MIPKRDENIQDIINKHKESKNGEEEDEEVEKKGEKEGGKKFEEMFPDIQEDRFESSDDDEEKKKNERLERLSKVAAPSKNTKISGSGAVNNMAKTE